MSVAPPPLSKYDAMYVQLAVNHVLKGVYADESSNDAIIIRNLTHINDMMNIYVEACNVEEASQDAA